MLIFSIDLMKGKAVQLVQGRKKVLERDNPRELARDFFKYGDIAVIDLDAALESGQNDSLLKELCQIADCRVGGGIRSPARAKTLLSWGAKKIIMGTLAFEKQQINKHSLKKMASEFGRERLIIAIDSRNGQIVTRGWKHKTGISVLSELKKLEPFASELLFTCVEREGKMMGTDLELIKKIKAATNLNLTVAGGISSIEEIKKLAGMGVNMQLGMAIYTQSISMADAFVASLKWDSDLIPVITTDESSQVLMQAYVNHPALKKTLTTGQVWYYSRSRKQLWKKGEQSGNRQFLKKIRRDCDGDSLLMTVTQNGNACHKGRYSCFGERDFSLYELQEVIRKRLTGPSVNSYTALLDSNTVRKKIMEEAQELIEAGTQSEIIWEAADLFYFILVFLAREEINLDLILRELKRRRRKPN
jgi:phosphoribosyl-ATP pyrophosphohydrolase/phosphoribosyl-AMP cyclohydrolase